jgi:hypothetical protein
MEGAAKPILPIKSWWKIMAVSPVIPRTIARLVPIITWFGLRVLHPIGCRMLRWSVSTSPTSLSSLLKRVANLEKIHSFGLCVFQLYCRICMSWTSPGKSINWETYHQVSYFMDKTKTRGNTLLALAASFANWTTYNTVTGCGCCCCYSFQWSCFL